MNTHTPIPFNPTEEYYSVLNPVINYRSSWSEISKKVDFPRPQGNLPMYEWGLTSKEQAKLSYRFNNINAG